MFQSTTLSRARIRTLAATTVEMRPTNVMHDRPEKIRAGDIYEDCAFHPVLCTRVDVNDDQIGDDVYGISLMDATAPRACSVKHCGVVKLSIDDVLAARHDWPAYVARRSAEIGQILNRPAQTGGGD